jgi:hypothetical protein
MKMEQAVFRNVGYYVDIHSPMKMEQCYESSVVKWISTRLWRFNRHSIPKRRLLGGYPLAYEDGTVLRIFGYLVDIHSLMKMEQTQCFETSVIKWISNRLWEWNSSETSVLSGYPLAYEYGIDTVFRNVVIKKSIVSHKAAHLFSVHLEQAARTNCLQLQNCNQTSGLPPAAVRPLSVCHRWCCRVTQISGRKPRRKAAFCVPKP